MTKGRPRSTDTALPLDRVIDVTIVIFDGGYSSTAIAPVEVFHSAGRLWPRLHGEPVDCKFRVRMASVDGRPVTSAYGVGLTPHCGIQDIGTTDLILLTAPNPETYREVVSGTSLLPWLRQAHALGTYIGGVCTGVAFLAEAGLLDGRRATTHWAFAETFRQRYRDVHWEPERFVTEDGRVFCSGGVYASIDLSLYLVEKFCGREVALECAKSLLVSLPRSRQSGYGMVPLSRPHSDDRIRNAENYLQQNLARDVSTEVIAERIGMSSRTLVRRFRAATGRLPGEYHQLLRVAAAKELLERGRSTVQSVASSVGYEDVAFFRVVFKRHTGMTPAEYRSRFGPLSVDQEGTAPDRSGSVRATQGALQG